MITVDQAIKILEHAQSGVTSGARLDKCISDVLICLKESVERAQRYMIFEADVSSDAKHFIPAILDSIKQEEEQA